MKGATNENNGCGYNDSDHPRHDLRRAEPPAQEKAVEPNTVTAIANIVLEPDVALAEVARSLTSGCAETYPKGFALDKLHRPHISCRSDSSKRPTWTRCTRPFEILAEEKPATWKLTAHKYYYIPLKEIGLAGIVIEPTDDMVRFQQKLIEAVKPFTVKTGTAAAFATTKERSAPRRADDRLGGGLRSECNWQEVQPTRDDRHRDRKISE